MTGRNVNKSRFRVLVVDDYEPWRRYLSTALRNEHGLQIVGEVSDGLEAVQKAQELRPDLILLDIGLPTLNGIEAARLIRQVSPASKILFVSDNRSADIAEEAMSTGAEGYVVKSDAARELLPAVKAILVKCADRDLSHQQVDAGFHRDDAVKVSQQQDMRITRRHEAGFYSEDGIFLDGFTEFVATGLMVGKAVIFVATETHRKSLIHTLQAHGLDVNAAIQTGRYIPLDAADTLSTFMVNGSLDPARFQKAAGDLITAAAKAVNGDTSRVAACGECAPLLWTQGNVEAAIQVEHLWDDIAIRQRVDILCGYSLSSFQGGVGSYAFEKICSAHSGIHSR